MVDLAKGHVKALEKMGSGGGGERRTEAGENVDRGADSVRCKIYNLGTGRGTSVLEMVTAFEKASGEKLPYRIAERRAGDLPELCAKVEKAERELGWKAERTIDDAMRDTLKFLGK